MNKFIIFLLLALPISANAQTYAQDTVWTKVTDQSSGFYQVKFSNNDSIIVGHGYEMDMFYNAQNGEEIFRIPGNTQVFYFNNDDNFIRLNETRNCFEIYNARTFQIVDTLENDGIKLLPNYALNRNEIKLVSITSNGIRILDMSSKKIMISKVFENVPGLIKTLTGKVDFNCEGTKILVRTNKTYQISNSPPTETVEDYITIFDAFTLDSIDSFYGLTYFELSHNCQLIAFQMPNDKNGVVIYDFITKKIKKIIPINGFSLTGIEFSPDDKYIVTSNGPGANSLIVWDVMTGTKLYGYTETSFTNIDLSNNGKYLIISVGRYLDLINTKFITGMIGNKENQTILYPNPTTGELNFTSAISYIEKIMIIDINGKYQTMETSKLMYQIY